MGAQSLVTSALGLDVSEEAIAVKGQLWGPEMLWIFVTCLLSPNVTKLWQECQTLADWLHLGVKII